LGYKRKPSMGNMVWMQENKRPGSGLSDPIEDGGK
jgi:hypothetical protein